MGARAHARTHSFILVCVSNFAVVISGRTVGYQLGRAPTSLRWNGQFVCELRNVEGSVSMNCFRIVMKSLGGPGIESCLVGARFFAPIQTGSGAHPTSYTIGTGSFPGVKPPGRGIDHPSLSNAKVKDRVELYIYSPSGLSWLVLGWNSMKGQLFNWIWWQDLTGTTSVPTLPPHLRHTATRLESRWSLVIIIYQNKSQHGPFIRLVITHNYRRWDISYWYIWHYYTVFSKA